MTHLQPGKAEVGATCRPSESEHGTRDHREGRNGIAGEGEALLGGSIEARRRSDSCTPSSGGSSIRTVSIATTATAYTFAIHSGEVSGNSSGGSEAVSMTLTLLSGHS